MKTTTKSPTTLRKKATRPRRVVKAKRVEQSIFMPSFSVDKLLINGYVWDNPHLTISQRYELDRRAWTVSGTLVKECLERAGKMVTVWRYIGVRPVV